MGGVLGSAAGIGTWLISLALLVVALGFGVPCLVFALECLAGVFVKRRPAVDMTPAPAFALLVPAHNEATGIASTLENLKRDLRTQDRLIVIADNCTDETVQVARGCGAEVIERRDAERRGKGYAIAFGIEHIAAAPPPVVLMVDADCRVTPGSLSALSHAAVHENKPVQAMYLFEPPEQLTALSVVSALAVLVRSQARMLGLSALGLPCHLTGSGMAFPWAVIRSAPELGSNIVEDLELGIQLALLGHAPRSCPEARVTGVLPADRTAAEGQRRRWEHGFLETMLKRGPRLVLTGLTRFDLGLFALGLDLLVPPLALLVLGLLLLLFVASLAALFGASSVPALLLAAELFIIGVCVALSWVRFGRSLPLRYLLAVPLYVAWKLPLYVSFVLKRQKAWVRTSREG